MEEKITARIKLDETGRCESANCVYEESDTVIEKEFASQEEAMEFYVKCLDYVYQDGEFVHDPLPEVIPAQEPSEMEILGQRITDTELDAMESNQRITDLELFQLEGGVSNV